MSDPTTFGWGKFALFVIATAVVTILLGGSVAHFAGQEQSELAQRVDRNAQIAVQTARDAGRDALENRYVAACSLFTPPFPERSIRDLQICILEAEALPLDVNGANLASILERNLSKRTPKEK